MPAFSDDDLAAYYREVEERTAAGSRRRGDPADRRSASDETPTRGCPTPEKTAFGTLGAAADAILRARRERSAPDLRTYQCECGAWHLTSARIADVLGPRVARPRRGKGKKRR